MHVGENQKAQLLANIHCVHSKVVFQLRNWDESVQLKHTHAQTGIIRLILCECEFNVAFLLCLNLISKKFV